MLRPFSNPDSGTASQHWLSRESKLKAFVKKKLIFVNGLFDGESIIMLIAFIINWNNS